MEGEKESSSDRQGENEVHVGAHERALHVGLSRHSGHLRAQMEHFTRETHPRVSSSETPSMHTQTCTCISLSKTHTVFVMMCLFYESPRGDWGGGQKQQQQTSLYEDASALFIFIHLY